MSGSKLVEDDAEVIAKIHKAQLPICLTWKDISITAQPPKGACGGKCKPRGALKEPKLIIDGVSGNVKPGQFLAIIGASGKFSDKKNCV